MRAVAIYSVKGGVGKTATAVNLAYLASRDGRKTLLWDLDPQSSATYYLKVSPKRKGTNKKLLKQDAEIQTVIRGTDFEGFDLLPGDLSSRKSDVILEDFKRASKRVERFLMQLAKDYDLVVLDCPPGFSLFSEALLHLCHLVLVPTIPTPLSIRSLELLADYFDKRGLSPAKLRPFFSLVDRRKNLHRSLIAEPPSGHFRFLKALIPYSSLVEQMGASREPVHVFAAASSAASAFDELWAETQGLLEELSHRH